MKELIRKIDSVAMDITAICLSKDIDSEQAKLEAIAVLYYELGQLLKGNTIKDSIEALSYQIEETNRNIVKALKAVIDSTEAGTHIPLENLIQEIK